MEDNLTGLCWVLAAAVACMIAVRRDRNAVVACLLGGLLGLIGVAGVALFMRRRPGVEPRTVWGAGWVALLVAGSLYVAAAAIVLADALRPGPGVAGPAAAASADEPSARGVPIARTPAAD